MLPLKLRALLSCVVTAIAIVASVATSPVYQECTNDDQCRTNCVAAFPPPGSTITLFANFCQEGARTIGAHEVSQRPICTCSNSFDGAVFELWHEDESFCLVESSSGDACLLDATEVTACNVNDASTCQASCTQLQQRLVAQAQQQAQENNAPRLVQAECDEQSTCHCIQEAGDGECTDSPAFGGPGSEVECPEF